MPLEDELGDVLEKAMRHSRLDEETLAARTGIPSGKILDAIDYRPDLSCDEIRRLAEALGLNEVGLCAMGAGRYPLPRIGALPFCVWPLRMPHGIGVANAYLVAESGSSRAVLFDTGAGMGTLVSVWPSTIRHVEAVFLTHVEGEHAGGLAEVVERFDVPTIFIPRGAAAPGASNMGEGRPEVSAPLRSRLLPRRVMQRLTIVIWCGCGGRRPKLCWFRAIWFLPARRAEPFFPPAAAITRSEDASHRAAGDRDRARARPDDDRRKRTAV